MNEELIKIWRLTYLDEGNVEIEEYETEEDVKDQIDFLSKTFPDLEEFEFKEIMVSKDYYFVACNNKGGRDSFLARDGFFYFFGTESREIRLMRKDIALVELERQKKENPEVKNDLYIEVWEPLITILKKTNR